MNLLAHGTSGFNFWQRDQQTPSSVSGGDSCNKRVTTVAGHTVDGRNPAPVDR